MIHKHPCRFIKRVSSPFSAKYSGRLSPTSGMDFLNKTEWVHPEKWTGPTFITNSDQKSALIERFYPTLKCRSSTYFTAHQTCHYLDILSKILESYPNRYHRPFGRAPTHVPKKDENDMFVQLYADADKEQRPQMSEGKRGQLNILSKVPTHSTRVTSAPWARITFCSGW